MSDTKYRILVLKLLVTILELLLFPIGTVGRDRRFQFLFSEATEFINESEE